MAKREYIFNIIKSNFKTFGFQPIETPSFELSDTLLGKYGDEGDQLLFKVLNSGDYISKVKAPLNEFDSKSVPWLAAILHLLHFEILYCHLHVFFFQMLNPVP